MTMAIRPNGLPSPQTQPDALLRALGMQPKRVRRHLAGIRRHSNMLQQLLGNFGGASGMSPQGLSNMLQQGNIPAAGSVAQPQAGNCCCGGYAHAQAQAGSSAGQTQTLDLGATQGAPPNSRQALMNRKKGAMMERFLQSNPAAKQQLESMLGGKILNDGNADGVLRIQKFNAGAVPGGPSASGPAQHAMSSLAGIDRGASAAQGIPAFGNNNFLNMMVGALANTLGGRGALPGAGGPVGGVGSMGGAVPGGGSPNRRMFSVGDMLGNNRAPGQGFAGAPGAPGIPGMFPGAPGMPIGGAPIGGAPIGGAPIGAPIGGAPIGAPGGLPGLGGAPGIGGAPGAPGLGGIGGSGGVGDILGAPGMTVEDMVVMMLMKITKGFDKQIQAQAQKVNKLQQQQGAGGAGGKGGGAEGAGGKGGAGGGAPSVDVESMKLKRMIDKRSQMFDMLRQVIDKYNSTAKNMIDALGR